MQTWMKRDYALKSAESESRYREKLWQPKEEGGMKEFFDGLDVLEGVPLTYLIPQAQMLPPESLRFFCVDPNWVACMKDGAMSIGRNCTRDWNHDRVLMTQLQRGRNKTDRTTVWSGFFLRSVLVSGWQGMNLRCTGEDHSELCIRQRKVFGTDVMMVIAEGKIAELELIEPEEALCFRVEDFPSVVAGEDGHRVVDLSREIREKQGIVNAVDLAECLLDKQRSVKFQVKWEK